MLFRCGAPLCGCAVFVRTAAIHIFVSFFVLPLNPPLVGRGGGVCSTACCSALPLNPVVRCSWLAVRTISSHSLVYLSHYSR
jgi:hypothetical protein